MYVNTHFVVVATDPTLAFTAGLAQNAAQSYDLALPAQARGARGEAMNFVRGFTVGSVQQLAWEVQVHQSATTETASPVGDTYLGSFAFGGTGSPGDGAQNAGTGNYEYYVDGLAIPAFDGDANGQLHLVLVNRSATSKLSGASGELMVKVQLEPTLM